MATDFVGGLDAAVIIHPPSQPRFTTEKILLDAVVNLDKDKDAAVFLAAPKTTANGLVHEWLIDQLPSTSTAGNLEGGDWSSGALTARTRLNNAVQTFRRDFAITRDAVEYSIKGRAPGVSNEYEHQVENFLMATEQSIDARMVALGASALSASAAAVTDLARTGSFRNWQAQATVATTVVQGTASPTQCIAINVSGAWSRSRFLQLHEAMFNAGAKPNTLGVDPGVKADITNDILGESAQATFQPANTSAMAAVPAVIRQVHTDGSATSYTADIQFMRTDFGRVAILVDRFIPTASISTASSVIGGAYFLYDRSKARLAFWRPLRHYGLPPTGDHMKGYIHAGACVELLHPNSMGVGYNVTT